MTTTTTSPTTARRAWPLRLGAVAAATVANALIGALAPLAGVSMVIAMPGMDPGPVPVAAFALWTAVFGLLGWGTLALAELVLGDRARAVWTTVAAVVLLLSFLPSMSVGGDAATEAVLLSTHVVAAAILVPVFWRSARSA
ncbi:DUF6069 family protein [Nocardiopsis aegyptia]|uniref:Uncharacterized protein n=1 Tax=Nocardiopsis aegyptia TaxID=220378 RepID=A0A7Z0JDE1_9ACTN|nr:DUF6069 family protein [Nocardiopsis aegyptia]NYJ37384.1 hypothetical protein [Nocardiopsis aegyptia]